MKVVLLSGGGGGARFARGLASTLARGEVTVIGNVGDDFDHLGLHISPDLDSLLYTLAGLIDEERGWGRADETWDALAAVEEWGGPGWFRLGDRDLGLHLVRASLRQDGAPLSEVTRRFVERIGLDVHIVPATDDPLRTHVVTPAGMFIFQEWFVGRRHADEVDDVRYEGAGEAKAAPAALDALADADAILFAPSNPYLSIGPILAVAAIREAIERREARSVAVSPLVGGKAVTGPLDRMLRRMAGGSSPAHVTDRYKGLIDALVIDRSDAPAEAPVELIATDTLMRDREGERRLAEVALEAACG